MPCSVELLKTPKSLAAFYDFDEYEKLVAVAREIVNRFRHEFNDERPHTYLRGRTRCRTIARSTRTYDGSLPPVEYPSHFLVKRVTGAGTVRFKTRLLYVATALRAQPIGLEEVDDGIWSVYCCDVLLGRLDERKALVTGQLGVTHVPA